MLLDKWLSLILLFIILAILSGCNCATTQNSEVDEEQCVAQLFGHRHGRLGRTMFDSIWRKARVAPGSN